MVGKKIKMVVIPLVILLLASCTTNYVKAYDYIYLQPSYYAVWEIHGVTGGKIGLKTKVLEEGELLDILLFNSEEQFENYYKNGKINPCFWAMGGWHEIGEAELYLPNTTEEVTYYLVFDNTQVIATSMWKEDIETQYDDYPSGGFADGKKGIQVKYYIDFNNLSGNNIYINGPEIYKLDILNLKEQNDSLGRKERGISGFEIIGLIVAVVAMTYIRKKREG